MKHSISQFARLTSAVVVGGMLVSTVVFAADEATPAPQTPQTQADDTARGGRGNRGNVGGDPRAARGNFTGGNNFGGGRGGFGGLNLDEKQNELLREAMQAESDELRKLNEKLQAAQKEFVKAVIAEKYDDKTVREKADVVSKIQTDITVLRAKAFATVSPTLKPEQRDALENSRAASSIITGAAIAFGQGGGGGPQDQFAQDRNLRRGDRGNNDRGNNAPGGDPNQIRRRGGDRQGGLGQ